MTYRALCDWPSRSETYKDVEKKYKTAYIKCKSTEMAVQVSWHA